MVKVAVIGAGSVVFTRRLVGDLLSFPSLAGVDISLMDIDPDRLDLTSRLCARMVSNSGVDATVRATQDRREALDGADFVVTTIRVGDDDAVDREIPLKYGIDQAVGDTIGPGGVLKALRTVPVLLDICRDMEELCPGAWLLNYTNPMAIATWAINKGTSVRTVGLCHSVQNTAEQLAGYLNVSPKETSHYTAGINHMAWFLRFEVDGRDAYPDLRSAMDDPAIFAKDPVRFEVMKHFGYFVSESTKHMSEYVPYFRRNGALMERFELPSLDSTLGQRDARSEAHYDRMKADLQGNDPLAIERTNEYAAFIIDSMVTGRPRVINVNVGNSGLIDNLPDGCCVEVPCLADGGGVSPTHVGDLPAQCAALIQTNVSLQGLAVNAILDRDREAAIHAVMVDPLTSSVLPLKDIRRMVDEMLSAQPEYFEKYWRV